MMLVHHKAAKILSPMGIWLPFICIFICTQIPEAGYANTLTDQELHGYEQWLHSLENSIAGRIKADRAENYPLYPFGFPRMDATETPPYRYLSISRALGQMEKGSSDETSARGRGAFAALAMARNYRNLTEYESALVWYQEASHKDTNLAYNSEINREALATAVALDDSFRVVHSLINTLGTSNLIGREGEIVLAFRYLLVHGDNKNLSLLVQKVSRLENSMSSRVRFWQAYSFSFLKEWSHSLTEVRRLVSSGSLSHGLSEQERSWVLTALPDLLVMSGENSAAADLYRLLAKSDLESLRTWGEFQLASLNFLNANYLSAYLGFQRVCESQAAVIWQRHACELANLAERMHEIKSEGSPYGAAVYYK